MDPAAMTVSPAQHEALARFLAERKIRLQVLAQAGGSVRVVESDAPRRCTLSRLYVGGFIPCETARALAARLDLPVGQVGQLLEFLHIKVRQCALGCFK